MTSGHTILGRKGENEALSFLKRAGYHIMATNWRFKSKEIDIIARTGKQLVIIEVKTRSNDYFQKPEEAVTFRKQKFLVDASEAFIEEHNLDMDVRFDIIAIIMNENMKKIYHIEDAFYPQID
jgi:putative endonuclease